MGDGAEPTRRHYRLRRAMATAGHGEVSVYRHRLGGSSTQVGTRAYCVACRYSVTWWDGEPFPVVRRCVGVARPGLVGPALERAIRGG